MLNFKSKNKIKLSTELKKSLLDNYVTPITVSELKMGKDFLYSIKKDSKYYNLNKQLIQDIFSYIPLNNSCVGFVSGKSYFDFLAPHRYSQFFTRLDISSFFHSIDYEDVKKCLDNYITPKYLDEGKKIKSIDCILKSICCEISEGSLNTKFKGKRVLPMGYPSSPVVSNILFRSIDIQIQKYCELNRIVYTRYADDMLFSSSKDKPIHDLEFTRTISGFISQLSLNLNDTKTIKTKGHISLNGYVVDGDNEEIRLSNSKLAKLHKLTHMILKKKSSYVDIANKLYGINLKTVKFKYKNKGGYFEVYCKDQIFNKIVGNRSYLISIIKYNKVHNCISPEYISKVLVPLDRLNSIIDDWI